MRKIHIILISIIVFVIGIFSFLYFCFISMEIEDKYGEFENLYYEVSDGDLIIIDQVECGFIKRYDRDIFVEQEDCLKNILTFSKNKVEVYDVKINQTYIKFDLKEATTLKNQSSTKLIYKNF
ncbi:hypothetical protein [Flavobacterium macacae]|uniref:Uncharacterized protein n=1 Tax=Flavobacterium macacae TaxID=2488993 RepID=A0A3P3W3P2_9FLAO|nr:hypothetical protein [Flavobacterium macacae]RRJ89037.1 hypothetical protein EG849_13815 [Flavobacterium macacae]